MKFEFIKKHPDLFTFLGLFVAFYFLFFHGIGSYALMDVDETRYASMAHDMFRSHDFMTLYLNGEYFFEKPPLYFWLECLSFGLFGHVSEFTVRFPVCTLGLLSSFLVYFVGKKVVSRGFGAVAALTLATSAEFLILSKYAILDIVLAFCTTFSIFFGFMTLFCEEKNKKYFWWLFYIFSGLAVLAKGIPGFVLPFGTMFFVYIAAKKFKELFKPVYFIIGFLIFFAIVLPWHIVMLDKHDPLFFNEYIMKHHIARFLNSHDLGRKQPFYFFILTILWGIFPWIIPALATIKTWGKKLIEQIQALKTFDFNSMTTPQKFLTVNIIAALLTLAFFSASSTKLVTYILPIYPFLACIMAYLTVKYITDDEYTKAFNISTIVTGSIFLTAGIVSCFIKLFLPAEIYSDLAVGLPVVPILFIGAGVLMLISSIKSNKKAVFGSYVLFMMFLSAFGMGTGFNIDYAFGQNDLIKYAKMAKDNNHAIASYGFGRRYSLNYYYQKHVIYERDINNYAKLKELLADKNTVVIIRNKNADEISQNAKFTVIEKGKKYSLIKG